MGDFLTSGRLIDGTAPFGNVRQSISDALHDLRTGLAGHTHPNAIASGAAGFLSGADKAKLDGIASGAAALTSTAPLTVATANSVGVATTAARADHVHARGLTGVVLPFAGSSPPTGFLLCNGQTVSRTTYAALFAVIGTTYGAGDGSTTFNLPDLRGRAPIGAGQGTGLTNRALGASGGAETHTLDVSEMPSHTHQYMNNVNGSYNGSNADLAGGTAGSNTYRGTDAAGGGGAHNNMPPWLALNFIIAT